MKKLVLGIAASAALVAGTANAAITLVGGKPAITPQDTYQLYLSGASAPRVFIEQSMIRSGTGAICTGTVYVFKDNGNGTNQNAYYCVGNTANTSIANLLTGTRKNILLYKRSAGGSAFGIQPIINESISTNTTANNIPFLKIANPPLTSLIGGRPQVAGSYVTNCAGPVAIAATATTLAQQVYTCTYADGTFGTGPNDTAAHPSSFWTRADYGVSDVDPVQFSGSNTPAGFAAVTAAQVTTNLDVRSAFSQNFGIIVNVRLRDALQNQQFAATSTCRSTARETAACQPNLTAAQVQSIMRGILPAASTGVSGFPAMPTGQSLHICGRTNGSGTKAATMVKFLNYPCSTALQPKADTGAALDSTGNVLVHQMGSSGNLDDCMTDLNAGTNAANTFNNVWTANLGGSTARYAIGYQGTENNANGAAVPTKPYRFIKVNGFAGTLANAFNNTYSTAVPKGSAYIDWVDSTYQYNKTASSHLQLTTHPLYVANTKNLINQMIALTGSPSVIGKLDAPGATHIWGQAGFMANPILWPGLTRTASLPNPINRWAHAPAGSTTINNCVIPTLR